MARGADPSRSLRVYEALARLDRLGYAGKILLVAFVGTHIPLLALLGWFLTAASGREDTLETLSIALVATLGGTALTLWTLQRLLRPIGLTARSLRAYVADGTLPQLPTAHRDALGMLMADTDYALRRLDEAREALAHRDATTGLANRAGLLLALAERTARDDAVPFTLCALGIDGLGDIAAAFGRAEAERLLRLAAARLGSAAPPGVVPYHVDAATFAVVLGTNDPDTVAEHLSRFERCLERIEVDGQEHDLSCRLGVSLWPLDDRAPDALLDDALVALDIARRRSVPWGFYSEGSRRALLERYRLGRDLRRALARDELSLHYQPIVEPARGHIAGAEALLRWEHPERGAISPERFIPIAEESDLIELVGVWTLTTVCRQIERWREDGVVVPRIAVNLSARQFADPGLSARVAALVAAHDIAPGSLEMELTETSATSDVIHAGTTMTTLNALGIGMAIDDFGTGHSSLSHLRTMPFDKLKIDREFVRDVDSNGDHLAICRALIALGRELRVEVLAEGTETAAEVKTLRAHGCELFQGYHFHRPLPVADFTRLLGRERVDLPRDPRVRLREAG